MISALSEGYLIGLSLVILIGPVLFVLLHATLERGRACGLAVALGIFISDVLIVWACSRWGSSWLNSPEMMRWFSLAGGLVTATLGLRYWLAPPLALLETPAPSARGMIALFGEGFAVNFINPFVFLVWLGIIKLAERRYATPLDQEVFLGACIAGILTLDLLKVALAHRIRPLLRPATLRLVLRGAGGALLLLSIRLFYAAISS